MFAEFINQYGATILYAFVTSVAGYLAIVAKNLYTKYVNDKTKQAVAKTVVQAVEQIYKDLRGDEKLAKALEAAAEMLASKGITVTDLELRMLIEAAVGEFNDVFHSPIIMEGIDVDDLTDDQLRSVLEQAGLSRTYLDGLNRGQLLAAMDDLDGNAAQA